MHAYSFRRTAIPLERDCRASSAPNYETRSGLRYYHWRRCTFDGGQLIHLIAINTCKINEEKNIQDSIFDIVPRGISFLPQTRFLSSESVRRAMPQKNRMISTNHQPQRSNDSVDMIAGRTHVVKFLIRCESKVEWEKEFQTDHLPFRFQLPAAVIESIPHLFRCIEGRSSVCEATNSGSISSARVMMKDGFSGTRAKSIIGHTQRI